MSNKQRVVRVDPDLMDEAKVQAAINRTSVQAIVHKLLADWLAQKPKAVTK